MDLQLSVPLPSVVLGTIVGVNYGLLAIGLVLVYRSNRIINFAHGQIGLFAAAVFGLAVARWHVPYYVGLPLALGLGAGVALLCELVVIRRLRGAPRLMSVVATLGAGQFLLALGLAVNGRTRQTASFPQPPGLPTAHVGALTLTKPYMAMLIIGPLAAIALTLFLSRSRSGLAMRAAADNPEAARMAGIFAVRMSGLSWALAGALSALTAILILPSTGFSASAAQFGPSLLLRALAAAVIAQMTRLSVALVAGIGMGVLEQVVSWNYPSSGVTDVVLFFVIGSALALQRRSTAREEEKGSWAAVQAWRPVPEELRGHPLIRFGGLGAIGAFLAVAAAVMLSVSNSAANSLIQIVGFAIVGLSVGLLSGLGGQLTLGQFGIAAVGAVASTLVSSHTGSYSLGFLYAGVAGAVVSCLIGLPAIRVRGLMLTVTTLSFALVVQNWALQQDWALGSGKSPGRPSVLGHELQSAHSYGLFSLAVLGIALLVTRAVRRGGFGRLLVAVRDNEENARAFTVHAAVVKLKAFALAGALAGVGGAILAHSLALISSGNFPIESSIDVVAMAVIGGISVLAGPLLGALYVIGIPQFVKLDSAELAATQAGWLLLILYLPGGLAQVAQPLRDRLLRKLTPRALAARPSPPALASNRIAQTIATGRAPTRPRASARPAASAGADSMLRPVLEVQDLRKRFGGVVAVKTASFDVRSGETLGLIGPNGAGKTTLFELLGGFTRADSGRVVFQGHDISSAGPEARASRGLIRSFQDAALFPTMTVQECLQLSQERRHPTSLTASLVGYSAGERRKSVRAREVLDAMGLGPYRDSWVAELSTGTRRITEIACLICLEPRLLLLDEPSSGIAQRETEALAQLLRDVREALGLTMLIIEHDIPMIMDLSDRVIAMDAGEIVTIDTPEAVRTNPRVVEAYLGGSLEALHRSDVGAAPAVTRGGASVAALLREVPGVGPRRGAALTEHYRTIDELRRASVEELCSTPGIGHDVAARILRAARGT